MTSRTSAHCPLCGKDHLSDLVLDFLYKFSSQQLVEMYERALEQMLLSMRDDMSNKRQASYLSRIRPAMECYMKGVWIGLLASADEIVHDASGEKPRDLMLAKLSERVGSDVLGIELNLYQLAKTPTGAEFTPMHFLNASTHATGYFMAFAYFLSPEAIGKTYSDIDGLMEKQVQTLRTIKQKLNEGRTRDEIIKEVRKAASTKHSA